MKYKRLKMKRDDCQKCSPFYRKRQHFWWASLFIFGHSYFVTVVPSLHVRDVIRCPTINNNSYFFGYRWCAGICSKREVLLWSILFRFRQFSNFVAVISKGSLPLQRKRQLKKNTSFISKAQLIFALISLYLPWGPSMMSTVKPK